MERQTRELEIGDRRWRAVEAWRGSSGHALVYFLPLADGVEAGDDRLDRRASLPSGSSLDDVTPEELRELWDRGTGLTETERRFRAPDGRLWLAQSQGPVWAEGGVASGLTGVRFTSLEGERERLSGDGEHAGRASPEELTGWWRGAASSDEEGA